MFQKYTVNIQKSGERKKNMMKNCDKSTPKNEYFFHCNSFNSLIVSVPVPSYWYQQLIMIL